MAIAVLLLSWASLASPAVGSRLPTMTAPDLTGTERSTDSFLGKPTVLLVMTDRGAAPGIKAWWQKGLDDVPPGVQRKAIVSIGVPFFVPASFARSRARRYVPEPFWHDVLMDVHHRMAHTLGLPESDTPWIFVLDSDGRVVTSVHAPVGSPQARQLRRYIDGLGPPGDRADSAGGSTGHGPQ